MQPDEASQAAFASVGGSLLAAPAPDLLFGLIRALAVQWNRGGGGGPAEQRTALLLIETKCICQAASGSEVGNPSSAQFQVLNAQRTEPGSADSHRVKPAVSRCSRKSYQRQAAHWSPGAPVSIRGRSYSHADACHPAGTQAPACVPPAHQFRQVTDRAGVRPLVAGVNGARSKFGPISSQPSMQPTPSEPRRGLSMPAWSAATS